jgi:mediator of RNA polymerase II transcription subunit 14
MENHSQDSTAVLVLAEHLPNGLNGDSIQTNGFLDNHTPSDDAHTMEILQTELPHVLEGQISFGEVVSRIVQSIYAELSELAETMPNMSDSARKRTLVDWVVKVKRQIVKLYAVARWARDAEVIQKCMNITAFLLNHNDQFLHVISALENAKQGLDSARLRNHDLLTSLDVLQDGTYRRLPSGIKRSIIPIPPLTDNEVVSTLEEMNNVIRYRLSMTEIIPHEMSQYRIANGRVYFFAPKLFEASLCLRGADPSDGWFFVHVEFLFKIGGDSTGVQDFPRKPTGLVLRHITDEADARLAFYLPVPAPEALPGAPPFVLPPTQQLSKGVVDAPLVRVFNFLQIMSLSYQLEVLWYQAEQMRSLGWADHLKVEMTNNRKTLTVWYWLQTTSDNKPQPQSRDKLPPDGGRLTISIAEVSKSGIKSTKSPRSRFLFELQHKAKIKDDKPSDRVEELRFDVRWEAQKNVLSVPISEEESYAHNEYLSIDTDDLDLERILKSVIEKHTAAILNTIRSRLIYPTAHSVFLSNATLTQSDSQLALHVDLYADIKAIVTIDVRTGQLSLKDTGELATAGRGSRFMTLSEGLNFAPSKLFIVLSRLRISTIIDLVQQKANSLGLISHPQKNFPPQEQAKLGPEVRATVYIQLANFKEHYLVIVVTENDFRYALISVQVDPESMFQHLIMIDIAWIDSGRVHSGDLIANTFTDPSSGAANPEFMLGPDTSRSNLTTQLLRELYAYCCARVSYMNVERQLKLRGIPFTHVNPWEGTQLTTELSHIQSSLARSVPALCVQSEHILSGAPAAEAAMPNIRVIPLNWWCAKKAQVVTCVKLKYVQRPVGKSTGNSNIIRPSTSIIYDTTEAVVCFLSDNVDTCVNEFLEEWARVSKIVVIAREVSQMAQAKDSNDIKLLSFDLQTVQFAYAKDYVVSITCTDQLSILGGSFSFRFTRRNPQLQNSDTWKLYNPHEEAEPFLRNVLRPGHGRLAASLHRLVTLLRDTLPMATELEAIRSQPPDGLAIDTVVKAAGWYRIVYGDLRYALDFRLINEHRILIVDGSRSLFRPGIGKESATSSAEAEGSDTQHAPSVPLLLQPIPNFSGILREALKSLHASSQTDQLQSITCLDVGLICAVEDVSPLAPAIHHQIMAHFQEKSTTSDTPPPI